MQKVKFNTIVSAYHSKYHMQKRAEIYQKTGTMMVPVFQIKTPLQWSTSCWMIWAVQPVKVLTRF